LTVLENHPEIDICGAGYRFFGSRNYNVIYPENAEAIKAGLLFGCCMIIPLIRKASIEKAGMRYEQDYFPAEDYRFWTQCALKGLRMYNIPEILFHYRMHESQVSSVMTNQKQMHNQVRALYFRQLFPACSQATEDDFIHWFSGAPDRMSAQDIERHKTYRAMLEKENAIAGAIESHQLKATLRHHLQNKIADYVAKHWFTRRYTPARLIRLLTTGIYFELPKKFRRKLIVKTLFLKTNRQ
jgi:hypothetical protein